MTLTAPERKRTIRNLIIFAVVAIGAGFLGTALDRLSPPADSMQGLGVLVWLVSPLLANILLRTVGGDGWQDFGLKPNFKSGWVWYLVALAIVPLTSGAALGLGAAAGVTFLDGLAGSGLLHFLPLAGAALGAAFIKNLFEEFSWRGYLTPRLEALGLHPIANAGLTGIIWAGWHVPYYLYFLDRAVLQQHTPLPLPFFILLSFLILPLHALAYGELRLLSKSVWAPWILHNADNALRIPLLAGGFAVLAPGLVGVILTPGTEGIVVSLLTGLIGLGLLQYRMRMHSKQRSDLQGAIK